MRIIYKCTYFERHSMFQYILWMQFLLALIKITRGISITPYKNTTQCGNLTCVNNAKCKGDGLSCMCQRGYQGTNCSEDLNECNLGDPCLHRGYCHNNFGSYRCMCLEGWTGEEHCDVKNNNSDTRRCTTGWMGDDCKDHCLNNSMCQNQGVCEKMKLGRQPRGHHCVCAPGWTGLNCSTDIDECSSKACPDNYICTNTQGSYQCNCLSGWKGINCSVDIDECIANPCQHSSICENAPGYYKCSCAVGWKSDNCSKDIDECTLNLCSTREHCINTIGSFKCTCNGGWNGAKCDVDIDECKSTPCLHLATCENTLGSYICHCNDNWSGLNCELDGKTDIFSNVRRTYTIVGIALCSVLLVSSVAVLIGLIQFKCGKDRGNITKSSDKPNTQVQQIIHNQRYMHTKSTNQQYCQQEYHLNQHQTLQLHVHVHQLQQIQDTQQNEERERECQDIQERELQQEEPQEEEEHRSKYWLRKLNKYFIRITNPLWRY